VIVEDNVIMMNFCAKAMNSIAKMMNLIANGTNIPIVKATNSVAKTCSLLNCIMLK